MEDSKPTFIIREASTADKDYVLWLSEVKERVRQCQIKAAVRVNTAMLELYWGIGRDLVTMKAEQKWGAGVTRQFSLDMRREFPGETGYSYTNVKNMKRWYLFYAEHIIKGQHHGDLSQKKSHQLGDLLEMPDIFGMIPWRHHVHIVSKATSLEEAIYYVNETIEGNWSRSMLEDSMAKGAFKAQSKALTNFSTKLPALQSRLAQEILKDPYNFDFLTMKQDYDEKDLEEALISNITNFLLELGQGLIICKSYDKTIVEWSLQDISKPLGVAAYQLQEVVERTVAELELKAKGRK